MVTSHNLTINQFCAAVPCGRTKTYELIADGEIEAIKLGKKTLIPRAELERLQARLPRMRPRTGSREEQSGTTSRLLKVSSTSDECRHANGDDQRPGPARGVALSSCRHVANLTYHYSDIGCWSGVAIGICRERSRRLQDGTLATRMGSCRRPSSQGTPAHHAARAPEPR
jgi:excisionase family DNA binding protein